MKAIVHRYLLHRRLRVAAYHLNELDRAETELKDLRAHFLRQSGDVRRQLMDLDIRSRRA